MTMADHEAEIPEELPGQLTFVPEDAVRDAHKHAEKTAGGELSAPDLTHPPFICILLCDILAEFDNVLPEAWLYDIMVKSGHINYFQYADVTGFLLENEMAAESFAKDGTQQYMLLPKGIQCAKLLRLYVPKLYRDQVKLTALRYVSRQRAMQDIEISYIEGREDWAVCVKCKDHAREMFFLRIHAPTKSDAEQLGERILRNPSAFFSKVLDTVMQNEEEQFDLRGN